MEESGTIDKHISLRMTRLFMTCIGLWFPENSRQLLISNLIIFYTMNSLIIALIIMSIDFYHIKGDLRVSFLFIIYPYILRFSKLI